MYFTKEDILKIQLALSLLGVKDSELQETSLPKWNDYITIVLDNKNKKVSVQKFLNLFVNESFINLTAKYDTAYVSIKEAIKDVPITQRKKGLLISFIDINKEWRLYQFKGELSLFNNYTLWDDVFNLEKYVINSLLPDEEDITITDKDSNGNSKLKFKDKKYDPSTFSGMGHKILRKNIVRRVNDDGTIDYINYLSVNEFSDSNTIYEIRYDFDLNGLIINIPNNCILSFKGGTISNGTININDAEIQAPIVRIFNNIKINLLIKHLYVYPEWFGAVGNGETDDTDSIQQAIDCGEKVFLRRRVYTIYKPLIISDTVIIEGTCGTSTLPVISLNGVPQSPKQSYIKAGAPMPCMIGIKANDITIKLIALKGETRALYGIMNLQSDTNFISRLYFTLVTIYSILDTAFYLRMSYLVSLNECIAASFHKVGFYISNGTTAILKGCYAQSPVVNTIGIIFLDIVYSSIVSSVSEHTDCGFLFKGHTSSVSMIGCGVEDVFNPILFLNTCDFISIDAFFCLAKENSNIIYFPSDVRGTISIRNLKIEGTYKELINNIIYSPTHNSAIIFTDASVHPLGCTMNIIQEKQNLITTLDSNQFNFSSLTNPSDFLYTKISKGMYKFTGKNTRSLYRCNLGSVYLEAGTYFYKALLNYDVYTQSIITIEDNLDLYYVKSINGGFFTIDKYSKVNFSIMIETSQLIQFIVAPTLILVSKLENKNIKGTTQQRPTLTTDDEGFLYYDTTLHEPIWWNGTLWIDGTNTPIE